MVALTFDDCDIAEAWSAILDALSAHDARASFFPNGFRAEAVPELAARTVADGHTVGSHGWDHRRLPGTPGPEVGRRLDADRRLWSRIAGVSLRLLRPPFGAYDDAVASHAAAAGYTDLILWDVDPEDWREPDPKAIAASVLRAAHAGSIVLLHAVDATADALPDMLNGLRGRGLQPVALDAVVPKVTRGAPNRSARGVV